MAFGWDDAIGIGASLLGGMMGNDAAGDAAATQAAATREANATQEKQYQQTRADLGQYRGYGGRAVSKLEQLLGLGGTPGGSAAMTYEQARAQLAPQFTKTVNNPGGFYSGPSGESDGRWVQGDPSSSTTVDEPGLTNAIQQLMQQNGGASDSNASDYGSLLKPFTGANLENDPGYQFQLKQGQQGIDRRAAAGGNYFSGAALKEAARFGNDYAGTKLGEAFARDSSQKAQQYNFLTGAVGTGQNSAAMTGQAGANMANQVSGNLTAMGNAQGAAGLAGAGAIQGGITSGLGNYQQGQFIDALNKRNPLQQLVTGGNSAWGANYDRAAANQYDPIYG